MSGPIVLVLRALLAISLYVFLAWAFFNLGQDIKQQGAFISTRKVPPIDLTISVDEEIPHVHHFTQTEITIGRDPVCDCPVDDDSISTLHARLSFHHSQWWLEDLGSKNGTLLNQQSLAMPTVVMSRDEFTCGETHFTIGLANELSLDVG